MAEPIPKQDLKEKIKDIRKALKSIEDDISEKKSGISFGLPDLLCRVGELELCMEYNFKVRNDLNAELLPNRLCSHYDGDGAEEE